MNTRTARWTGMWAAPLRRLRPASLAAGLLLAMAAAPSLADTAAPERSTATPPAVVRTLLGPARLAGEGPMRWFGLRIYDARLWTSRDSIDPAQPFSSSFALELRYARTLSGAAIASASHDEIVRLGLGSPAQRQAWLAAMQALFPDVRAGDRLTGVHRPGEGVAFYRDEQLLGRIEDPGFGPAFFAIWLDPRTVAPALRTALLGLDGEAARR